MPTLRIPGRKAGIARSGRTASVLNAGEALGAVTLQSFEIQANRGAGAGVESVEIDGSGGKTVLVLHLNDGTVLFTSYEQFCEDFPRTRGRGIGEIVLKGLEVLHVHPAKDAVSALAARVERQLAKTGPGLYRVSLDSGFALSGECAVPDPSRPALVLIHGTASSSYGAFHALGRRIDGCPIDFASLSGHYGDNIFAFEHKTLTESPVENAIGMLRTLPDEAELHLATHSRGGLVGDLLCLGQVSPKGLEALGASGNDDAHLAELISLLRTRKPRVTRYVRVACPARGTTLASRRADRWFSMLLSLTGKALEHFADPVIASLYDALQDFLVAVAAERLDPVAMPGMAAMMPDSKLIRLLNLSGVESTSDLSVIAGSAEGKDVFERLKFFAPGKFYGGKNDLVVNYASMDGGVPRREQRLFPAVGPEVHHLNYFESPATRRALLNGLLRSDGDDGGYQKLERSQAQIPRTVQAVAAHEPGSRPVAILIPGLFASQLACGGDRIWCDYLKLANGGLGRLEIGAKDVEPVGVLDAYYRKFIQFLGTTHEVVVFPYDWRLSLQVEARRLAAIVEQRINTVNGRQPVAILAHSTGGLLARVMFARRRDLWANIRSHERGRLVMLGTPNRGSYEILRMLTGESRLMRQLSLLDGTRSVEDIAKMLGHWPGLLELLPSDCEGAGTVLSSIDAGDLAAAAATRELAATFPFDNRMLYVAGWQPETPVSMSHAVFLSTEEGDGWVPWATGIPKGVATYYSCASSHGELMSRSEDFPALLELLDNGSTARLPTQPPAVRRGYADGQHAMAAAVEDVLPNESELMAAAVGGRDPASAAVARKPPAVRIRVEVVHGDLAFARHAVAVGHYEGDSIVGPEALLDRHLEGRLTRRSQLGVYPGRVGTAEVFLNADPAARPAGAVVVGLGKIGDLKPKDLEDTFHGAVLKFALAAGENADGRFRKEGSDGLSTLLVGTMANVLAIEESLTAMLRAVRDASRDLDSAGEGQSDFAFRIRRVEVLEVYEDRAIRAAEALGRMANMPEFADAFDFARTIDCRGGALRRTVTDEEDDEWWSRLRIRQENPQDPLTFSLITNRARTESEDLEEPQRAVAMIESAIGSPVYDAELAQSLFELLVPNRLKEYAPQLSRLVLTVDANSARYPWELMQDRLGRRKVPLAVDTGLIRKLDLKGFEAVVRQSSDRTALVIANPRLGMAGDDKGTFPPLPAASEEGRQVGAELRRLGIGVTEQIETEGVEIRTRLYSGSYRILHLAGHGVQQYRAQSGSEPVNGMAIGRGDFLTPVQIGQLRVVPELVFINCCHSGRTDVLAANLAVEFIRIGVRAVIAAGWAVDDAAAATFARRFYSYFLDRRAFGDAVRMARADTYELHPGTNTWGAYQCYGDPGYRFDRGFGGVEIQEGGTPPARLYLSSQLTAELENLASGAGVDGDACETRIRERIGSLKAAAPPEWWDAGEVRSRLGSLYGVMGDYGEAIRQYEAARSAEAADVRISGIEQEASLRARAAVQNRIASREDDDVAAARFLKEIDEALLLTGQLLELGRTTRRYLILGSICKRRAMWAAARVGEEPVRSLRGMRDAYRDAVSVGMETDGGRARAFLNWILSRVVLGWFDESEPAISDADREGVDEEIRKAQARPAARPTFWSAIAEADGRLVKLLLEEGGEQQQEAEAIARSYRRGKDEVGSPLEVATVVEHLEFIGKMARLSGRGRKRVVQSVELILGGFGGGGREEG